MADQPEQPKNTPEKGPQRDRGSQTNLLWYALVFSLVGMVIFSTMSSRSGELVEYSEFVKKIESGELPPEEVHNLQIGPMELTWQSKSDEYLKSNRSAEVERYRVD